MHLDDAALDGVRAPLSERTGAAGDSEHRLARNRAALVIPAGQVRVRTAGTRREVVNAEPALDGGLIGQGFSSQATAWPGDGEHVARGVRRISGIYAAAVTIRAYYEGGFDEDGRLTEGSVEWVRSKELVGRVLPQPPARVADVAGGTGVYAVWLAELGHEVSLLDLVPSHVARARERAGAAGVVVDCVEGDARALPWPDDTFDVVM